MCWNEVVGFCGPLIVFTVSPEEDQDCEDPSKHQREPGSVGYFCEGGAEVERIDQPEEEEATKNEERVKLPDYDGDN